MKPKMILKISIDFIMTILLLLLMEKQTGGALDPTIYPLVDAWGFVSGKYHVPTEQELMELLQYTGYEKVSLQENTVSLPAGTEIDLGAANFVCDILLIL